jgi:oxygen-dependent protoporphyrinogen oxidase
VLIRAFLGGSGRADVVEGGEDRALVATARAGLEELMGSLGQPLFTQVFRHLRASPQLLVGHPARIRELRQQLAAHKGLYLAGAAYEGIGIPDCVDQAKSQSARLIEELC